MSVLPLTTRTWMRNPEAELHILRASWAAEAQTQAHFGGHEERITGVFVDNLHNELEGMVPGFQDAVRRMRTGNWFLSIHSQDLSAQSREEFTGCDLGLILVIDVEDLMKRCAFSVFQSKKISPYATVAVTPDFSEQLDKMTRLSNAAFALFYDQSQLFSPITVMPANVVKGISRARKSKRIVKVDFACNLTGFASFLLYDFIAGWVGDERFPYPCEIEDVRQYLNEKLPVHRMVTIRLESREKSER